MVNFALSLVTLAIATASSVAAVPAGGSNAAAATTSETTFSFSQWVEDIIANPDTAMTVDEAIAAAEAAAVVKRAAGLLARDDAVNCEQPGWPRANGRDAAWCVDYLARLGQQGTACVIGQNQYSVEMCRHGNARIAGSKPAPAQESVNCNDVARTAGLIFDTCWRADDTIMGSRICITNNRMQINLLGI
ncbi:hypothetical protein VTH82DRAFT_1618 [Thermothelomyces myriococcoides]